MSQWESACEQEHLFLMFHNPPLVLVPFGALCCLFQHRGAFSCTEGISTAGHRVQHQSCMSTTALLQGKGCTANWAEEESSCDVGSPDQLLAG